MNETGNEWFDKYWNPNLSENQYETRKYYGFYVRPKPKPYVPRPEPKWKVTGDGMFFSPFWVEAPTMTRARARACDILAGSNTGERGGRRYYGTVDKHIVSIVRED